MLFSILQMGIGWIGDYEEIILSAVLIVGDILLLKLGLFLTKAEYRTKIKWVSISFLIQFGAIFLISSPILVLGFSGALNGLGGPPFQLIIPAIIFSLFLDFNLINVIHRIGLKRAFIVAIIILVPIVFAMFFLIQFLSTL
ncbi:MAG: hypothetical protein EU517_00155 [Promethearchaeota archaeon]|nr:MAG: hypothetical protein EU517_00155 [Candidatus Lokiarchaeota archaeon]